MDATKTVLQPSDFRDSRAIGRGKDSTIYAAQCDKLGGQVAVKVYDKRRTSASKLRAIKREASILIYLGRKSVPGVTQYYGAFQDARHICIVMEFCPNGDLLERLLAEGRAFSEDRVAEVATALLSTLQRMHSLSLLHRDVKLENVFIGANGELLLGDFGLAMSMKQESAISPVGTVEYFAPEVVALPRVDQVSSGTVDPASIVPCDSGVDIWALGITLYELLSGHLPFDGRDKAHIKAAITSGNMRPLPRNVSVEAADFVACMLEPDRKLRATAAELLEHPFVTRSATNSPRSVLPPVAEATAFVAAEDSPWATKGATSCAEFVSQPKMSAPKLSIPESPDQIKGSWKQQQQSQRTQLVTPVAFWNSDMQTPDCGPDAGLVRACWEGRDSLPTPGFPLVSPPAPAGAEEGGCGDGPAWACNASDSQPAALPCSPYSPAASPLGSSSSSGYQLPAGKQASSGVLPPWAQQQQKRPQQQAPAALKTGGSGKLLSPYSPAACSPRFVVSPSSLISLQLDQADIMSAWRAEHEHGEALPWTAGRLFNKIGQYLGKTAAVR